MQLNFMNNWIRTPKTLQKDNRHWHFWLHDKVPFRSQMLSGFYLFVGRSHQPLLERGLQKATNGQSHQDDNGSVQSDTAVSETQQPHQGEVQRNERYNLHKWIYDCLRNSLHTCSGYWLKLWYHDINYVTQYEPFFSLLVRFVKIVHPNPTRWKCRKSCLVT